MSNTPKKYFRNYLTRIIARVTIQLTLGIARVKFRKGQVKVNTTLKQIRVKKGLTQVQLAEKANISVRHYQDIEAATSEPSVKIALLIAQALNTPVEFLFGTAISNKNEKSKDTLILTGSKKNNNPNKGA